MIKTNTDKYNAKIYKYILECIDSEDIILTTPEEKLDHFFDRFEREYNHRQNIRLYPNFQDRVSAWLSGLAFGSFPCYSDQIIDLAEQLHECKLTDKQQDRILANYWDHLAYKILQLKSKIETK